MIFSNIVNLALIGAANLAATQATTTPSGGGTSAPESTKPAGDPTTVTAQKATAATAPTNAALDKKLATSITLSNQVGNGTFVAEEFSDDPYFGQSLSLSPSYSLTDNVSVSARWSLAWELTTPNNSTGRRYSPSDVSFRLSHASLYKDSRYTGINVSGSLGAIVPTSYESRFRNTITNLSASLGLKRLFLRDKLTLSYSFGFTKYLPTSETPGHDPEETDEIRDDQENLLVACSASRGICAGTAGINPDFAISNTFGVNYYWTEKLYSSLSLGINNVFKFPVNEEFSDPNLPIRGRSPDTTSGNIEVGYNIDDTFSLAGGITSVQGAFNGRNDTVRFPFYDFVTPAANFTQFYLSLSATL